MSCTWISALARKARRNQLAAGAQVRGIAAGGFLREQDPDDFGGVPALGFAVGGTEPGSRSAQGRPSEIMR